MNAICLVIDRLHAGYVGALGNSWIDTPWMDRLAAESFVFDQMLLDTPQLEALCRSYWQGWHALSPRLPQDRPTLPALLRAAGITTALLTDDRTIAAHPLAGDFDELVEVDPPWRHEVAGEGHFEQTHLARCFVQILDWLQSAPRPFMLWCHLASLGTIWDAPLEFRDCYRAADAPPLPESAEVPERRLDARPDRDEILRIAQCYAGQVSLLDTCLEGLDQWLGENRLAAETLLCLTSSRGFPLGEHGRIGPCDEALYGELVHVPLVMRFPGRLGAATRSQALVEPADLWATLLDYWQIGARPPAASAASLMPLIRGEVAGLRDRLAIAGRGSERALRTPAWYLRRVGEGELYLKPDDFWEANNVALRCQEVVECLQDALVQFEQVLYSGQVADLPCLSDVLLQGLE